MADPHRGDHVRVRDHALIGSGIVEDVDHDAGLARVKSDTQTGGVVHIRWVPLAQIEPVEVRDPRA